MRALYVPTPDSSPVIGDLDKPEPADGEVLIKVGAVGLNPIDNVLAAGLLAAVMPHRYPLVLGRDVAGTVEAVGDQVSHVTPGDLVLGSLGLRPPIHAGTLAEYAVVPADAVAVLPEGLDLVTAAALPLASAAAEATIRATAPMPGEVVLVNGATGGVGLFAVQLAQSRGAIVVATGTERDAERLHELGAAVVVDFTVGDVAAQLRESFPDGADVLINLVGQSPAQVPFAALRRGARVASTTTAVTEEALSAAGATGSVISANPVRGTIGRLADLAASGHLSVDIAEVLPLSRALDGLATIAAGAARGKIVVSLENASTR